MLTNHFINFPYHCFCRLRFVQFFIILFSLEEGRVLGGLSIPRSVNFLLKSIDPPISPQDSGCPIFIFFIKQYWIYTRHHAEPNINILLLTDWLSFGEGIWFEIGRPRSRGWKNFGRRWTGSGSLKNWTIFMDII